jgi:LysM repeat protein
LVAVPATAKMVVPAPTKVTPIAASGPGGVHVVVKGESLLLIASREKTSIAALCAANGLDRNAILHPGQKLKIPAAGSAPAPKTTKSSASKTTSKVTPAAPVAPQFSPLKIISLSNPAAVEPNVADAAAAPAATK